ncbi:tetratricopeptide repeat protein [Candidatus Palauibacter sp.]|uniref:tetratricopeptide repeat protein n=1 Tax=Candidatus Palauibacter sp. TaxID=3101350 RepID=UPI003B518C0E
MLSPATATVISAVAVFLGTLAVAPAYAQQVNAPLVGVAPDSLVALISAAELGDADAQYNLEVMYYCGEGVPQDYAEAVRWYRAAAEKGYATALLHIGEMYRNGEVVPHRACGGPPLRRMA